MKAAAWAVLVLGLLAVTAPRGRCSSLTVNMSFSDADPISPRSREPIVQGEGRHNAGLLKHILNMQPPFAPVKSSNPLCRQQSREFLKALDKLELWAVKMHDATGKVSSGVLNGNVNQLGDFSQCLSVGFDEQRAGESPAVSGKYCLARAYLEPVSQQRDIQDVLELVHSHKLVQSNAFDGIRFFPSFSAISWAFCVPAACSARDVEHNLQLVASRFNSSVEGVHLHVQVDDEACVVRGRDNSLRFGTLFTMLLISSVVLMAVVGTVCDQRRAKREEAMGPSAELPCVMTRVALAFSLRRNTRDLLKTDTAYDDISCLHGLRAVFSLVIYLIHRGVFGLFVPFVNRTELAEEFEGGWTMVFRAFLNNVDTFVVLSGLLTAYYSTKKLQSGKKLSVLRMYLTRYIKFTPIFLVTVLIVRDMDYWVQSPQMMRVAQHFVNGCKNGFWKSLIYMNNLDGMDHMCYPPSHQLVTDMQMYLAAPFVILLLWKRPKLAVTLICAVLLALAPLRYLVILRWRLSTFIYHGITLSQMVDGADRMYLNPVHRLTPYLSGILLGYYLRVNGRRCRLTSEQMYAGWALAVLGGFYSFFGPSDVAQRGYEYDAHQSAMFGVLQPLLWSTALCWAIHACHTGYGGLLNRLLSWNGFVVFSKLSYAFYMVQILLIFGGIATIRAPQFYRINSVLDLNELTLLVASSVTLTLLFLLPLTHLIDIATGADVRRAEVHPTTYNRFSARSQSMVDPRQLEKLQKQQAKGPRVGQLRFREGFMGFLHDTEISRKVS